MRKWQYSGWDIAIIIFLTIIIIIGEPVFKLTKFQWIVLVILLAFLTMAIEYDISDRQNKDVALVTGRHDMMGQREVLAYNIGEDDIQFFHYNERVNLKPMECVRIQAVPGEYVEMYPSFFGIRFPLPWKKVAPSTSNLREFENRYTKNQKGKTKK